MATSYPTGLDSFNNPGPTTKQDAVGYEHDVQHANANDAIEAIETELGLSPSGTYATVAERLDATEDEVVYQATQPVNPPAGQLWVDSDEDVPAFTGGLPTGGTTNQLLRKTSNADYAVGWVDPPTNGGGTGSNSFLLMGA